MERGETITTTAPRPPPFQTINKALVVAGANNQKSLGTKLTSIPAFIESSLRPRPRKRPCLSLFKPRLQELFSFPEPTLFRETPGLSHPTDPAFTPTPPPPVIFFLPVLRPRFGLQFRQSFRKEKWSLSTELDSIKSSPQMNCSRARFGLTRGEPINLSVGHRPEQTWPRPTLNYRPQLAVRLSVPMV